MELKKFFSLKWRWLLLIIIINIIFFYMQGSIIYECQRGGCDSWYIDYWSVFPLIFFSGYTLIKIIIWLRENIVK